MRTYLLKTLCPLLVIATSGLNVQAAKEVFYRTKPHVNVSSIEMFTESGETLQARFESDLIVSTKGRAWGEMSFYFEDGRAVEYSAVSGSIEFDETGAVAGIRVLLQLPGFRPRDPLGLAQVLIRPSAVDDCLIYDFVGPNVAPGMVRFEVPGSISQVPRPKRLRAQVIEDSG